MHAAAAIALCAGTMLGLVACGGGGGGGGSAALPVALLPSSSPASTSVPAPAATSPNSMALTVSGGTDSSAINLPQVSVQICAPGTSTCQTIDHVLLDTGSTGIRIASAALGSSLLAALPQETVNGTPLDACQQFLDGYTWGTMRVADITLGPKSATSQPLQIVGDPSASTVPATCSDNDTLDAENTPTEFGANGVIGVAAFLQDCGAACAQQAISATYYACPSGGQCQSAAVPIAMQARNVVTDFAQDNNGVVLSLPAISSAGQGVTVGTLYFGVGTQDNNAMTGATVLKTDPRTLRVSASYKGTSFPDSFLDSGSNFFFLNDSTIALCSKDGRFAGFYCPANPLSLSASFVTTTGSSSDQSFAIASAQSLFTNNPGVLAVDNIAVATSATNAIDFGLPFFYGKLVAVLNEGQSALGQQGPFTALAPR
jgi:hypothetical protein